MAPKYCMSCGGKLPAGGKFCPSCGTAFGKTAPTSTPQPANKIVSPTQLRRLPFPIDEADFEGEGEDITEVPKLDSLEFSKASGGDDDVVGFTNGTFKFQDLIPRQ